MRSLLPGNAPDTSSTKFDMVIGILSILATDSTDEVKAILERATDS